ncbi:bifunctional folylpolyglutamate synthase/dihydrofolate synthase [Hazenella sp. IB182353]|uniref:bifunctional folylpolyglutamate synthase/dihydrofolate synthase n=1 Tax=Polycladospora coralii TaxID=2771432 RepID=UPI0017460BFF|nr:folylpolyglutamate synthase/dihydrofolate synthase family protein [Polycladospora coralii]MBS7529251.1 bifunctional folylpolyglutamate synthase/dihydrofolate synthase [Polycladospora coralii]
MQTVADVFQWMDITCSNQIKPGLERMDWMLAQLGNPQHRSKFIHIAGTNGKGSTAKMIASVLEEAKYAVGLFVSPAIVNWNERIQVNQTPISESSFVYWANHLRPYIEEMKNLALGTVSQFEFWTLIALVYFAYEACPGFVVWETGLGGRLDATNVVHPLISVITHIGWDHQLYLGESISEIASEKAGIIKAGVPVVCGSHHTEALAVVQKKSKQKKSNLYVIDQAYNINVTKESGDGQMFDFHSVYRSLPDLFIPLVGKHQLDNAGTALMTLEILRLQYATIIDDVDIKNGLTKSVWPARLEKIATRPIVLLDGAHNLTGFQALSQTIAELYHYNRLYLVIAMMADKDIEHILTPMKPLIDFVIATEVTGMERSLSSTGLADRMSSLIHKDQISIVNQPVKALQEAMNRADENDLILCTGSLYFVSEIRQHLKRYSTA